MTTLESHHMSHDLFDLKSERRSGLALRQEMMLRFWDRTDLLHLSDEEISEWVGAFHGADSLRKLVWEHWLVLNEIPDCHGSGGNDPALLHRVPVGEGNRLMAKYSGADFRLGTYGRAFLYVIAAALGAWVLARIAFQ